MLSREAFSRIRVIIPNAEYYPAREEDCQSEDSKTIIRNLKHNIFKYNIEQNGSKPPL